MRGCGGSGPGAAPVITDTLKKEKKNPLFSLSLQRVLRQTPPKAQSRGNRTCQDGSEEKFPVGFPAPFLSGARGRAAASGSSPCSHGCEPSDNFGSAGLRGSAGLGAGRGGEAGPRP